MIKPSAFRLFVVSFFALFLSCAKTVEGESKKWEANVAKVQTLAAKYPSFKAPLDARLATARSAFDAAAKLSDEAKVNAMAPANTALSSGFIANLQKIDPALAKLRESKIAAAATAGDESSRLAAKLASADADKTIDRCEQALREGAKDEASATALVEKLLADIVASQKVVDTVLEQDKKKVAAKEADKKAVGDAAKADSAALAKIEAEKTAAVADWQCDYCKGMNKHDELKCGSCGAPKPAPKPAAAPAAK